MSFTDKPISTNKELGKPWWKTALVDAGGALGGAGSVGSLIGPAISTPVGVGACVLGGVLGGASASVGYAGMIEPSNPGGVSPQNPLNTLDDIGSKHNDLVNDFIRDNNEITAAGYFSYVSENKDKYGEGEMYLTEEFFSNQLQEVSALNETSEILDYIGSKLPASVNKENFKAELSKIANSSTPEEFISKTKNFENQFFESNSFEKADEVALKAFFSTLRFSASIW
jgi:hypothetical protein